MYFILNQNNKEFLRQVEVEFRAQIEKIKKHTEIYHIDSHVHTHAIPAIFKIAANLAKEYNIPFIRTQYEKFYMVNDLKMHMNLSYFINIIKIILLNIYTIKNKKICKSLGLKTNDYLIGVGYTGMMNSQTLNCGLKVINEDSLTESLIHPCLYTNNKKDSHTTEFSITVDKILEDTINRYEFEITNFKNIK